MAQTGDPLGTVVRGRVQATKVRLTAARLRCGMTDRATPNLPARDSARTSVFYAKLGFIEEYRDDGWLILRRNGVTLEFFPLPGLDPSTSSFSCCLRLDDVDSFYSVCRAAEIPETTHGWPRIHPPRRELSGLRIGALIDPDGSLLRLIQN
jgi:hypothetical protein